MRAHFSSAHLFPAGVVVRGLELAPPSEEGLRGFAGIAIPASLEKAILKRRVDFAAGRWVAREALRACAAEVAEAPIPIGSNRAPVWPPGVVGSIAHTAGYALAAAARAEVARAIGIDVEGWMRDGARDRVGDHITHGDELDTLVARSGWSEAEVLTLVFSAKESLYKCLYSEVERWFGFHDARIEEIDGAAGTFVARLLVPLTPSLPAGLRLEGKFERRAQVVMTGMVRGR
jgi:4'-phosphopantetheinyl transferase EntD